MLKTSTLQFLASIKENNYKEWFDGHRKEYTGAKNDFAELVDSIIKAFGEIDKNIAPLAAKDCLFRINRDVRFSKNKDPYKTNMGASLCKGGKKSPLAGYYIHCEPGGKSFVGGGVWMPETNAVKKIRQEIDYCFPEFSGIVSDKDFGAIYGKLENDSSVSLTREPKGYTKDNPAIDYLKLKSWIASAPMADTDWTKKDTIKTIVDAFTTLKPMIDFLNRALDE